MQNGRSEGGNLVPEILLVDEDLALSRELADELSFDNIAVTPVADGSACLNSVAERIPAAIVLDISEPERSGLDVLRSLKAAQCPSPIVVVSGSADVRTAVEAMKCGALDFFEKPLRMDSLAECLRRAMRVGRQRSRADVTAMSPFPGWDVLTRRERDVLTQIASGASNKEAGRLLNISPRTVEVHRARIMQKLGARNAADLVRIVLSELQI